MTGGETTVIDRPVLVTGGAGFIGSNFVHHMIERGYPVVTLDALTYAGNRANLSKHEDNPQHIFVEGSILDRKLVTSILSTYKPRAVVNFAAESHVDRSIDGPSAFIETNIVGVYTLLEAFNSYFTSDAGRDAKFLHVSTDEVYGSLESGAASESSVYAPTSPYAASKASADHLVSAWQKTFGTPAMITNCSNNYGPYQFPEKLIPLMILKAVSEDALPIYGNGLQERDWLHVSDHCRALELVLSQGRPGQTYNVASGVQYRNIDVVTEICAILDRLRPRQNGSSYRDLMEHVQDRPAHDVRYAVDASKIERELTWKPLVEFNAGIQQTVEWYLANPAWTEEVSRKYSGQRLGNKGSGGENRA